MAASKPKVRIPGAVLARARQVSAAPKPKPPPAPTMARPLRLPREKIVQALKKLHPMD